MMRTPGNKPSFPWRGKSSINIGHDAGKKQKTAVMREKHVQAPGIAGKNRTLALIMTFPALSRLSSYNYDYLACR